MWRFWAGIRARLIITVLALTALALATAGVGSYLQTRALTEQRVTDSLDLAVDLVTTIANENDPATGTVFTDPEALLQIVLQRIQYSTGESALAFVDGQLWWTAPEGVALRPELDADFVAHVQALSELDTTTLGSINTVTHHFRYIVVPVHFANGESGALVQVYDMQAELAPLSAIYLQYFLISLAALTLVGLLIWLLVGRLLAPIATLRDTADRISEVDLTQRVPITGQDELGTLAVTVNTMLDRLETAVSSQRELLDDVGHELRTPLTIIRGNLEVMDPTDADDVQATKTLLVDEVDRMHRLVEDLLLIAKSDQTDFIQPRATDISTLTDDTFIKATALGHRDWVLTESADGVIAVLDPQRTTQAWLQLATNAVQYSADGTVIELGSRVAGDTLELWVRDQGVGIAPEELAMISQRYSQGQAGRSLWGSTETGHRGLGLAIVNSILAAQNGQLRIESTPQKGSTFTMLIPLVSQDNGS